MTLLSEDLRKRLIANGRFNQTLREEGKKELDFMPLVKIFLPGGTAKWLLSEINPDNRDVAFGLCDLGVGFPEVGSVSVDQLESFVSREGLPLLRDDGFKATQSLGDYAEEATFHQRILA